MLKKIIVYPIVKKIIIIGGLYIKENLLFIFTILIGLAFSIIGLIIYFFPTIKSKGKKDRFAIFVLNLAFGWSVIGWVVALIWACKDDSIKVSIQKEDKEKQYDELERLSELKDKGIITEEEFNKKKQDILGL